MPRTAVLAVVLALASAVPAAAQTPAPPEPAPAPPPEVLVVGDSLAVGMRPALKALLPDYHLTFSVKSGITTPQGMARLRGALRFVQPQAVLISLGTNDGPDGLRFADRIGRTMRMIGPDRCVVWSAIQRAPRKGPYRALNRSLRAAADVNPKLTVIGWDHLVNRGEVVLRDGVHPYQVGYERRARRYAAELRRGCG